VYNFIHKMWRPDDRIVAARAGTKSAVIGGVWRSLGV